MAQTNVATGSNLALTAFSTALSAQLTRAPGNLNALTGPPDTQADAEATLKQQTAPGMPFVRITDLNKNGSGNGGDKVTVDAFDVVGGKPIMGDRNAEGLGQKLSSSSFDMLIDLATFNVDAGGKMSRQRTRWNLRSLAKAVLQAYFPQLIWQRAIVHCAGMRGSQTGSSWHIPLATDADFAEIMINAVKAPTYNRHYVLNAANLTRGGLQAASLATTDTWRLANLDNLALIMESMDTKIPPPRFMGDEQAYDAPLKGVLWMPPSSYNSLITDVASSTSNLRAFQAAVGERQKWASKSPIFRGEGGIWRGLLVKKMEHTIKLAGSASYQYVTVANRLTETETAGTVGALSASFQLERSLLMGAQVLARAEGSSNSGVQAAVIENAYNAGRSFEYLGEFMGGERKFRFQFPNEAGDKEFTDNVLAIDAAAAVV